LRRAIAAGETDNTDTDRQTEREGEMGKCIERDKETETGEQKTRPSTDRDNYRHMHRHRQTPRRKDAPTQNDRLEDDKRQRVSERQTDRER